MTGCKPCEELTAILDGMPENGTEFKLESYNIKSMNARERQDGKRILQTWKETKVPFMVFDIDGREYLTYSIGKAFLPDADQIREFIRLEI